METVFLIEDLLNTMIALEAYGNQNYRRLSQNTQNLELKQYFFTLSEMELKHKQIIESMLEEVVHFSHVTVDDDYKAYVQSLLRQTVRFLKLNEVSVALAEEDLLNDFDIAFDLAITLEKDAILFLIEMRELLPKQHHSTVTRLIDEERSHLRYLYDYRDGRSA